MTSAKQAAANRSNGRHSRGPRTGAGKARASRNAFRHGLASFTTGDRAMAEQVERVVDAICAGDHDPLLREQAVMVVENQLWLSLVRAQKVVVIDRMLAPKASPKSHKPRIARPIPRRLQRARPRPAPKGQISKDTGRDEYDALRAGMDDLVRLLRYERRACSRRTKALRGFMAIKFANLLGRRSP